MTLTSLMAQCSGYYSEFGLLFVIVIFESGVFLYNIMCCVHECIFEHLIRTGETTDVTDFSKDHFAVYSISLL